MPYKTQAEITSEAKERRLAENEALLDNLEQQNVQIEETRKAEASKKRPSVEKLLAQFDKSEKLRVETEALKPRLENEIAETIASGEALDEKLANSLATRRGMLEMIPAKLEQIRRHQEGLKVDMDYQVRARLNALERRLAHTHDLVKCHIENFLRPLMSDEVPVNLMVSMSMIHNTKINRRVIGLIAYIQHGMAMGKPFDAARALIAREAEADAILAEADKLTPNAAK